MEVMRERGTAISAFLELRAQATRFCTLNVISIIRPRTPREVETQCQEALNHGQKPSLMSLPV